MQKREASRNVPTCFGIMKIGNGFRSGRDDTVEDSVFSGKRTEYDSPALVYLCVIGRLRLQVPDPFPNSERPNLCVFQAGKLPQGIFRLKPEGLERYTVRTPELPS